MATKDCIGKTDNLKLENQLCFPMYKVVKEVITTYSEFLTPLGLTYTQYLVMMVMWEYRDIDMKSICEKVCLDSNTLTPVINRLVKKGYLSKKRGIKDKRSVIVSLEPDGETIREKAVDIPGKIYDIVGLSKEEADVLYNLICRITSSLEEYKQNREKEKNIEEEV